MGEDMTAFPGLTRRLSAIVSAKNHQYGDSAQRAGAIIATLFPDGIRPSQYEDVLLMVRVVDKLCRLSVARDGVDRGGESPWTDIAGYALIGWQGWERKNGERHG